MIAAHDYGQFIAGHESGNIIANGQLTEGQRRTRAFIANHTQRSVIIPFRNKKLSLLPLPHATHSGNRGFMFI